MVEIPDKHVQHAFDVLRSGEHAQAKAAYEFSEKHLKAVVARLSVSSNAASAAQREAEALASDTYEKALTAFRLVAETYFKERDRREAASAIIEAWRTIQSDLRAAGKVG